MTRQKRFAILVSLWALAGMAVVSPGAAATSAAADSICSRLAAQMRASPGTVLRDRSAPKMLPWIVTAASHPAEGDPVFRHLPPLWRTLGGRGATFPTVQSLPGTDLSMVSAISGSADCLSFAIFEWKPGSALRVLDDPPIRSELCSRRGVWGGLATVLGQPAFTAYGSLNPDNMDALVIIAPWRAGDKRWGRPCPVSIRFLYRYEVAQLYCGAGEKICRAARRVAPEVRRRYHAWDVRLTAAFNDGGGSVPGFQFRGPLNAEDRALVARARRIGIPKSLPSANGPRPRWLRRLGPYGTVYFPVRLDGTPYVGAATRSGSPPAPYSRHHWLFLLFRVPEAGSHRLVPLAAFTVRRVTAGVRSIEPRNESAPADRSESTAIPIS